MPGQYAVAQSLRKVAAEQFLSADTGKISDTKAQKVAEAVGSLLGAGGATWLAFRIDGYAYAYVVFLFSSVILMFHFYQRRQGWVALQQLIYTVINVSGVYCWIFLKT